ncbi:HYC_CC_PP family protein [Chitinophaga rhizosphaerae]|uniref:HYC_CC_PP family protein n=1 Tax=Chitinophaga rhizosphaerae TaxID=1864947 RepID=UPI000F800E57|nr:hypothetical protein [Chitinophaga rhizosphaerae]
MKQFLTLILALLYMSTSTGATFHMHYCAEKLVDVSLWHDEDTHECGVSCTKKCCKDVHLTIKLEKDQQMSPKVAVDMLPLSQAALFPVTTLPVYEIPAPAPPADPAPPPLPHVPAHILHCHFRI